VERPNLSSEVLVRDIIDIDSTYEDFEALDSNSNLSKKKRRIKMRVKTIKSSQIKMKKQQTPLQKRKMNLMFHLRKWKKK